jgi:hypothetical protein
MTDAAVSRQLVDVRQLYELLRQEFDVVQTDTRGGVEITFITGEQCATRLNETLTVLGWSFRVIDHGINQEADEAWVLGEIAATINGQTVIRQQFGSQKIKRSRSTGVALDLGFDLKGAATDCMKKCASLLGVGLYLSHKAPTHQTRGRQQQRSAERRQQPSVDASELRAARQRYEGVRQQAIEAKVPTKTELPAPDSSEDASQIDRWTAALRKRIEEASTAAHPA